MKSPWLELAMLGALAIGLAFGGCIGYSEGARHYRYGALTRGFADLDYDGRFVWKDPKER